MDLRYSIGGTCRFDRSPECSHAGRGALKSGTHCCAVVVVYDVSKRPSRHFFFAQYAVRHSPEVPPLDLFYFREYFREDPRAVRTLNPLRG